MLHKHQNNDPMFVIKADIEKCLTNVNFRYRFDSSDVRQQDSLRCRTGMAKLHTVRMAITKNGTLRSKNTPGVFYLVVDV